MSTFIASNISDGTTTVGTEYVVNGSAKAWVNFNGTGTIAIRDSLNVASLTDNGTGDYTVNFSSAFAAADYGFLGQSLSSTSSSYVTRGVVSKSASALQILFGGTSTTADYPEVSQSIHGDLA